VLGSTLVLLILLVLGSVIDSIALRFVAVECDKISALVKLGLTILVLSGSSVFALCCFCELGLELMRALFDAVLVVSELTTSWDFAIPGSGGAVPSSPAKGPMVDWVER
jgi:hypothetical protein